MVPVATPLTATSEYITFAVTWRLKLEEVMKNTNKASATWKQRASANAIHVIETVGLNLLTTSSPIMSRVEEVKTQSPKLARASAPRKA